jgi:hypothetical protein
VVSAVPAATPSGGLVTAVTAVTVGSEEPVSPADRAVPVDDYSGTTVRLANLADANETSLGLIRVIIRGIASSPFLSVLADCRAYPGATGSVHGRYRLFAVGRPQIGTS